MVSAIGKKQRKMKKKMSGEERWLLGNLDRYKADTMKERNAFALPLVIRDYIQDTMSNLSLETRN